jgi:hypothetical protein
VGCSLSATSEFLPREKMRSFRRRSAFFFLPTHAKLKTLLHQHMNSEGQFLALFAVDCTTAGIVFNLEAFGFSPTPLLC